MEKRKKRKAYSIVESYDGKFTVNCIAKIKREMYIPYSEMQNFRVCYDMAKTNVKHLSWEESVGGPEPPVVVIHEGPSAARLRKTMNSDLRNYQLVPKNMQGESLLDHQIKFRELNTRTDQNSPSNYLDAAITNDNIEVLKYTRDLLCGSNLPSKRIIFADSFGTGAKKKLAVRKIDAFGRIRPHCAVLNNTKALDRFQNMQQMAASIAEISKLEEENKEQKKDIMVSEYVSNVQKAMGKLTRYSLLSKLTKKELASILYVQYKTLIDTSKPINTKPKIIDILSSKIRLQPTLLGCAPDMVLAVLASAKPVEHTHVEDPKEKNLGNKQVSESERVTLKDDNTEESIAMALITLAQI